MNFWMLTSARLISGFATGVSLCATCKIIEEYVPLALYATASPFNIFMGQLGSFLALMSGVALPNDNKCDPDPQAWADNTSWHFIFGFTFIWLAIGMGGFLLCVRHDTPKFYVTTGQEDNAIKAIHKIYTTSGSQI